MTDLIRCAKNLNSEKNLELCAESRATTLDDYIQDVLEQSVATV